MTSHSFDMQSFWRRHFLGHQAWHHAVPPHRGCLVTCRKSMAVPWAGSDVGSAVIIADWCRLPGTAIIARSTDNSFFWFLWMLLSQDFQRVWWVWWWLVVRRFLHCWTRAIERTFIGRLWALWARETVLLVMYLFFSVGHDSHHLQQNHRRTSMCWCVGWCTGFWSHRLHSSETTINIFRVMSVVAQSHRSVMFCHCAGSSYVWVPHFSTHKGSASSEFESFCGVLRVDKHCLQTVENKVEHGLPLIFVVDDMSMVSSCPQLCN